MANVPESGAWVDGVYQLEQTDAAEGGEAGLANLQATQLGNRTAWLKANKAEMLAASPNFGGPDGTEVTHNLGTTSYRVLWVPLADPGGDLGEVWVTKSADTVTIHNSGGFRGQCELVLLATDVTPAS